MLLSAYLLGFAALTALPLMPSWRALEAFAPAGPSTRAMLDAGGFTRTGPLVWLAERLLDMGIRPARLPWQPTGVDYGNTDVPPAAEGDTVCLAWQYRPRRLEAVPPGVTALAPTWFYVEDNNGVAEVNKLDSLLETRITNWDPAQYVSKAHEGGAEVWGCVVSFTPSLSAQVVTDSARRSEFISRMAGWVQEYNLDGVNFDFENMDPANAVLFTAFVEEFKRALPPGCAVSVSVTVPLDNPSPKNWWQCYDREGLGRVADYVAVMTYDNPDLAPVAAIDWVKDKARDMLELVPARKILLGIPFYGVDFRVEAPQGERLTEMPALKASGSRKTMTPSGLRSLLEEGFYRNGDKEVRLDYWIDKGVWNEEESIAVYSFVDTDGLLHLVYCEDERSLMEKGRLLTYERLGGAAVWRLEFGTETLWNALLTGIGEAE